MTATTGAMFAAHIITADAQLGDPEIVIMTAADEAGSADPIIGLPLPDGVDWRDVLAEHGWRPVGDPTDGPYATVGVEPVDWPALVRAVTYARAQAQAELDRQDAAWRTVIADAMRADGVPRRAVSEAAGITDSRAYQIRDGRR